VQRRFEVISFTGVLAVEKVEHLGE
jgi:hypothetical protein